MGRVSNLENFKVPPLIEVKALARSPDMNRSPEISQTLRRYRGDMLSPNIGSLPLNWGILD
jgi:hypothetical protein